MWARGKHRRECGKGERCERGQENGHVGWGTMTGLRRALPPHPSTDHAVPKSKGKWSQTPALLTANQGHAWHDPPPPHPTAQRGKRPKAQNEKDEVSLDGDRRWEEGRAWSGLLCTEPGLNRDYRRNVPSRLSSWARYTHLQARAAEAEAGHAKSARPA